MHTVRNVIVRALVAEVLGGRRPSRSLAARRPVDRGAVRDRDGDEAVSRRRRPVQQRLGRPSVALHGRLLSADTRPWPADAARTEPH